MGLRLLPRTIPHPMLAKVAQRGRRSATIFESALSTSSVVRTLIIIIGKNIQAVTAVLAGRLVEHVVLN